MEPIIHFLVPLLLLLAVFPELNKRKIILFAFLTIAIDLDFFIPGMHRVIFYNIFFITLLAIFFYFIINKEAMYLSLYFTISHLLFDLSKPGIALLYPLVKKTFYFDFNIIANGFIPKLQVIVGTLDLPLVHSLKDSFYLTTQGILFLIITIAILIIKYSKCNHYLRTKLGSFIKKLRN